MTKIISTLVFDENSKSDQFLKIVIENIIDDHIVFEINDYEKLNKKSKWKYNSTTFLTILFSSLLPLIIFVSDEKFKWVSMLTSAGITILAGINYTYNLKYEWETNLFSSISQKGLMKEWELRIASIKFSQKSDNEKIVEYSNITEIFLKNFNAYETEDVKGYFSKLRDFQQMRNEDTGSNKR